MRPLILRKSNESKLEISVQVLTSMLAYVQDLPRKKEAGGVLLGRHILDSSDIVVDEITVPMRRDRRGRHYFYRDQRNHQQAIGRVWRESGGTCPYVGEWHTHPEAYPAPSELDLRDWQRKLREDVFTGDTLQFIIVGVDTLRVWEGRRKNGEFRLIGEYFYRMRYVQDEDPT